MLILPLLAGCATVEHPTPSDPLESWNRAAYEFNDSLDRHIVKPVAQGYQSTVPSMIRQGVGNFFANLGDAWSTINAVLQLKAEAAGENFTRFWANTFFGLGGILDVATEMQIPRHYQDFGLTLAHWGVGSGPYLVLPVFGPSTLRDTVALPVDWWGDPVTQVQDLPTALSLYGLRGVHNRAGLLGKEDLMSGAVTDRYSLLRDVYLQYRRNQVYDGDPPDDPPMDDDSDATDSGPAGQPSAPAAR